MLPLQAATLLLAVDEEDVTPGVAGFFVTLAVIVVAVLLIFDMVRRMRRVRYREEARERIAAEQAAAEPRAAETDDDATDRP